jgi:hypothetical protein
MHANGQSTFKSYAEYAQTNSIRYRNSNNLSDYITYACVANALASCTNCSTETVSGLTVGSMCRSMSWFSVNRPDKQLRKTLRL